MRKQTSSILDAVHETASDLCRLGIVSKQSKERYDTLCVPPVPDYSSEQIKSLRERYRISQAVMASILNTSLSTIQKWEIGEKHPGGPSKKLLNILDRKGIQALI